MLVVTGEMLAQIPACLSRGMPEHLPALGHPTSHPAVIPAPGRLGLVVIPVKPCRINRVPVGSWWPWLEREQ